MTLIAKTESHGDIEAGFFSVFTEFARLGEYTFATRHLCELVQHLSQHPQAYKTGILGYDVGKFWEKFGDYSQEIIDALTSSSLPELQRYEVNKCFDHPGEIDFTENLRLAYEGRVIPIEVAKDEQFIEIGQYKMTADNFRGMAFYLADGGWLGWRNSKPEYAEPTMLVLKNPTRKLFEKNKK